VDRGELKDLATHWAKYDTGLHLDDAGAGTELALAYLSLSARADKLLEAAKAITRSGNFIHDDQTVFTLEQAIAEFEESTPTHCP